MKLMCRCNNIQVDWDTRLGTITARQCGCDYCTEHGCHYVSDPNSLVQFSIADPSLVTVTTHGTETARFLACSNCGLALVISEIEGNLYSVLNAKVMGLSLYSVDSKIHHFTNETTNDRLARRKNNWSKTEHLFIN